MLPNKKSRTHWIGFAAFIVSVSWFAAARADDVLDRGIRFHIAASPLANALIEFSTQSGIQVAAADADVAQQHSNGVNGAYSIHDALSILLQGTNLQFSRIGATTIAIRNAPVEPAAASMIRSDGPGVAAKPLATATPQPDPKNATSSSDFPDVTVIAPRPPTDQELADDSLYQFIVHHATTPYSTGVDVTGSLARWRGGRSESICPLTLGLDPGYNAFVSARLRALAGNVGAPVQSDLHCKDNVRIVFTTEPEKLMGDVYQWASSSLGIKYPHQRQKLLLHSSSHAIQGWYITAGGGSRILNADAGLIGHLDLLPIWPLVIQTGLHGAGCCYSGIVGAIIVVNTTKATGYTIGSIADYIAMLTLSLVQSPGHCDVLPSILDLMSSGCSTSEIPTAVTAGDLAFLKALYYHNTGLGQSLSRSTIQTNMMHQFKGH